MKPNGEPNSSVTEVSRVVKKKKLTKDEKIARKLQLKAQKIIAAEEKKKENLQNFLKREQEYACRNSTNLLEPFWEKICGELTHKNLLDNLKYQKQNLQRVFSAKDEKIEQIKRWREEAKVQHKKLFEGHVRALEHLIDIYNFFQKNLLKIYNDECENLLQEFKKRTEYKNQILQSQKDYYEQGLHAMTEHLKTKYEKQDQAFTEHKKDLKYTSIYGQIRNRELVDCNMNQLREQIQEILKIYQETTLTPEIMDQYKRLYQEDVKSLVDINQMETETQMLEKKIIDLKYNLEHLEVQSLQKIHSLKHERETLDKLYLKQKQKLLKINMEKDKCNLRHLIVHSNKPLKHLKSLSKYGETLIRTNNICSKYENSRSKKMNYLLFPEESCEIMGQLTVFFQKLNDVKSIRDNLKAEKIKLLTENQTLKCRLKKYFTQNKIQ